jgi:formamidase
MSGLAGLNKTPSGMVLGLVQLQLPVVETTAQLAAQTQRIVNMVGKARRSYPGMDLVVFPEYALHGLSMSTADDLMVSLDGPEVAAFKAACVAHRIWGCFSIMEKNPQGHPYNTGLIIDDQGQLKLYYRKFHPWVPVEPWEPGNMGIPVIEGPKGIRMGLIICHDGMFPEMARECAYKGAELMIRTAGYTAPIRHAWQITNQANAFQNLMVTASVCLCGSDGTFDSMGEAMVCNIDGTVMAQGGGRVDEIVCAEIRPDLIREARQHWGVENNIYQLYRRGYVAVKGGAQDCPYTFMQDMVAGQFELPWEAEVVHTDGQSCGFATPSRHFIGPETNLLEGPEQGALFATPAPSTIKEAA